jgi:choline-sulfatase
MSKRHIVFILSDQHNPSVRGCAGDPTVRTPHLDKLAASGVLCENTYCVLPLCVPSGTALLAG